MGSPPLSTSSLNSSTHLDQRGGAEECVHRYHRLFENAPLVAYSLDHHLRTLYISPYCLKTFGYSEEEIQKDHLFWIRHIHPEDQQRVHLHRERHLKECDSFNMEYRIIHRDQTVRHIINHTIPITHNKEISLIDGFVFDITEDQSTE